MNVWKVRDDLFIRGMFDKRPNKLEELQDLGVTTVICMLRKTDHDLENIDWLTYRKFPLPDTSTLNKDRAWGAAKTARTAIYRGEKVLIHCISSRDRAPTAAALTLTLLEGISGAEAAQRVRSAKKTTFSNKAFLSYLLDLPAKPCPCGCGQGVVPWGEYAMAWHHDQHLRPEEFTHYGSWHGWLRSHRVKTGTCVTCGKVPNIFKNGNSPTHWSYIGNDPRCWEPDPDLYIEECITCNVGRAKGTLSC